VKLFVTTQVPVPQQPGSLIRGHDGATQ